MGAFDEADVKILAGTDFPNPYVYPGFSLHDELQLLVNGGMTPASVLRAATLNPALFMGREESIGTIETGKVASMVLLDANPLEEIANTRRINAVFLRGKYLDRMALDELMETAKTISATVSE